MDTNTTEYIEDISDQFCYELAMALRRILGLPMPWDDLEEEEAQDDHNSETA